MKSFFTSMLLLALMAQAQDTPSPLPAAPSSPTGSTVIESDSLDLNLGKKLGKKQGIFRGNVKVE